MPEYLTKEEIKEWRSSLEKITLEEFAARRGKVLEQQKHTNDLIDIVMKGQPVVTRIETVDSEKITTVKTEIKPVKKAEIKVKPTKIETKEPEVKKEVKLVIKEKSEKTAVKKVTPAKVVEPAAAVTNFEGVEFEKPLTEREQKVFEMFYKHKGHIVYAKDLADLLALPRDYVYKYIKTLRAKIKGDKLENADKGGYVLKI